MQPVLSGTPGTWWPCCSTNKCQVSKSWRDGWLTDWATDWRSLLRAMMHFSIPLDSPSLSLSSASSSLISPLHESQNGGKICVNKQLLSHGGVRSLAKAWVRESRTFENWLTTWKKIIKFKVVWHCILTFCCFDTFGLRDCKATNLVFSLWTC